MKVKCILFCLIVTYSAVSIAGFSEVESSQLESINNKMSGEVKTALDKLNKSIDAQVAENPERKVLILDLKKSWGEMIDKKCQLEIFDSKGTDAEIAEMSNCLVRNYQEEITYLNAMLP